METFIDVLLCGIFLCIPAIILRYKLEEHVEFLAAVFLFSPIATVALFVLAFIHSIFDHSDCHIFTVISIFLFIDLAILTKEENKNT